MDNKQHVQLPNNMTGSSLVPKDLLVYVSIKRFMNGRTKESSVGLTKIVSVSGLSKPTVIKSIKALEKEGYIEVLKDRYYNRYVFNKYNTFEPFSYEFLDDTRLSTTEKSQILAAQQYMFKDNDGWGKISFSNKRLAEIINVSEDTVNRTNKSLEKKGLLTVVKMKNETGISINGKFFHLDELGQAIIWKLQEHEERIEENEKQTKELTKQINQIGENYEALQNDYEIMVKEVNRLRKLLEEKDTIEKKIKF